MNKILIFLILVFNYVFSQEGIKEINVSIDVESDRWVIVDYDIPKWGKNRLFYGSSSLNAWHFDPSFIPNREYKIKGGFGWEVDFYLSDNGDIEIRNVEKGPFMKNKPIVKVIPSGWRQTKRIRIMMPELIEVYFNIPFEYGDYKINVFDRKFRGDNLFEFPEGNYEIEFESGKNVKISINKEQISVSGMENVEVKKENGKFSLNFPLPENLYYVDFEIPLHLYPEQLKNYHTTGRYKIKGKLGWEIEYEVKEDGIKLINLNKGPILNNLKCDIKNFKISLLPDNFRYVFFTKESSQQYYEISNFLSWYELRPYYISDEELNVCGFYLPDGKYKFGNINFEVKDAKINSIGVMKNLGMKIEIDDYYWKTKNKAKIKTDLKGKVDFPVLTIWAKKYNEGWEKGKKIYEGKLENEIEFVVPEIDFENYSLRFNIKEKVPSNNPKDYIICSEIPYFPIVSDGYKPYIFTKNNQRYFYQGDKIEFSVDIKKFGEKPEYKYLELLLKESGNVVLSKKINLSNIFKKGENQKTLNFFFDTKNLKPSDYLLIAKAGEIQDSILISLIDSIPETNFIIHAYGGEIKEGVIEELSKIGVNTQINNGAIGSGWIHRRSEVNTEFLTDLLRENPYIVPLEKISGKSRIRQYFENLIKNRIKLIAQYGCAHQFFHYSTCFLDPEVQKTIARDISLYLQIVKEYNTLYGINLGDEAGTPRGPTVWDDHCNICLKIFEEKYKIEIPFNIWDPEKWREWIVQNGIWGKYYYFKQIQMPELMRYVKNECDRVLKLPYHTQGGNLNYFSIDAGYPPISNEPYGFNTAHWYPHYGSTLWNLIGVEFMKMGPKKIPNLPLIWSCDDFYTTRHEVYLCIADGVDGVGYFHIPAALGNTSVKEPDQKKLLKEDVHPKLIKFGDLFSKITPERKIAVLFSFTQQLEDLKDCYDSKNAVGNYSPSYRQVHRAGMAFLTLWRAHFPASIISEEDIKLGELKNFEFFFITGLKKNLPEIVKEKIEEFISNGGEVFLDKETEIEIKGAEKLNFDFSEWYWNSQGVGERTGKYEEGYYTVDYPFTIPKIKEIEKILSNFKKDFDSPSPFLIISPFKSGDIEYLICVNDNQVEFEKRKNKFLAEYLPLSTDLIISGKKGIIYDVFEGKEIGFKEKIPVEISPGDMKLFAILPEKIWKIDLKFEKGYLKIKILSENGKVLKGNIPVEILFIDASGNIYKKIYRSTDEKGEYSEKIQFYKNINYPLTIQVKENISNIQAKIEIKKPSFKRETIETVYEIYSISDFLKQYKGKEVWIVFGNEKERELIKKYLLPLLSKEKIKSKIFSWVSLPYKEYPYLLGRGIARTPLGVPYYYYPLNLKIERPLIVVGTPDSNKIIRDLIKCEAIPTERSICQVIYKLFDWDYDTFLIAGFSEGEIEGCLRYIKSK